ncbi:T-complex protein 1 subunit alpha [Linnemannia exigua]|uniref:T-complex protein 1 subunit alpha n=1 Tax=Linnemannia exigua TaxID=604196 RepID=A0AAD4H7V6_9FUNG|nr:T-complex protein 1 subunit alpha [Linnemannia exigua]
MYAAQQSTSLFLGGERTSGQTIRDQNANEKRHSPSSTTSFRLLMHAFLVNYLVLAASSIANIVKSSLGPVGLDKMIVNEIGDVTITNDGATILNMLELAQQQDKEVGDGTTSVVIIAAELLKRANELVKNKIHPTTIITGYRMASREACNFIADQMAIKVDTLGRDCLVNAAKTSMSSKIIGSHDELFSNMAVAVDAMLAVKSTNSRGESKYPVKAAHGKCATESTLINEYALNCTVASQAMKTKITNAKIAYLDINLQKVRMNLGVHIMVDDPDKLEDIRKRESDITTERTKKILATGANVILTTKGIDDMCLKLFVEAGAMAVRRCKKEDLRRIPRPPGEETYDASYLGYAEEVVQERISDDECILVKGTKAQSSASIILRGANDFMLDEMERSLHDSLCVVKRTLESGSVVPGGGAVETALNIYIEKFATTLGSREQLAIAEFASALLVIPKTLAVNAAKDSTELVATLRVYHNYSQTDKSLEGYKWYGLDLIKGEVRYNVHAGVLEPALSRIRALRSATETALSILRIDDMITVAPEQREQDDGHGH